MYLRRSVVGLLSFAVTVGIGTSSEAASSGLSAAKLRAKYSNCNKLNVDYPNGVGFSANVEDRVIGSTPAVTTFVVDGALYLALWAGSGKRTASNPYGGFLDRDKDGIACEKP
jgi:hypothetical protein